MRPKKEKPVVKPKEPEVQSTAVDGDAESQTTATTVNPSQPKELKENVFAGQEVPFIYDSNMMLDAILKINTINFAGNLMLSWGQVKL